MGCMNITWQLFPGGFGLGHRKGPLTEGLWLPSILECPILLCLIATSWAPEPPAGDKVANSQWDFRGGQWVVETSPCPVALQAQRGPHSPPSPVVTHLRSEPGFLFLLPRERQRRKGH